MDTRVCVICKAEKHVRMFEVSETSKNLSYLSKRCRECIEIAKDQTSPRACVFCKEVKPVTEFYRKQNTPVDGSSYVNINRKCKACHIKLAYYAKYSLSHSQFNEMIIQQDGKCGICGCALGSGRFTKLCIDRNRLYEREPYSPAPCR
jgi:hypothetical protein